MAVALSSVVVSVVFLPQTSTAHPITGQPDYDTPAGDYWGDAARARQRLNIQVNAWNVPSGTGYWDARTAWDMHAACTSSCGAPRIETTNNGAPCGAVSGCAYPGFAIGRDPRICFIWVRSDLRSGTGGVVRTAHELGHCLGWNHNATSPYDGVMLPSANLTYNTNHDRHMCYHEGMCETP